MDFEKLERIKEIVLESDIDIDEKLELESFLDELY